ncbi:hypothetical protein [Rufibacter soli]
MLRLSLLLLCLFSLPCLGQIRVQDNQQVYRVVIEFTEGKPVEGVLYAVQDSLISVMPKSLLKANKAPMPGELLEIPVSTMQLLKIRKMNANKKGFWIGALLGTVAGAALGNLTYKPCQDASCFDFGRGYDTFVVGVTGLFTGSGIGAWIGSRNKKFHIMGRQENYDAVKVQLQLFTYSPPAQAGAMRRP